MTAEVLKDGGDFIVDKLTEISRLVYEKGITPTQWTSSIITPLPKKGNLELMTNYRGISLMSIAAKVFNRVLLNRIRGPIDGLLRKNQAGFRPGRSCIQQIHILRRLIEEASTQKIPLFITFIDFQKAFDSIDREMMFAILRHYGIPEKIVAAIRVLYDNSSSRVYVQGEMSESFRVTTGVLQGDVLAPFLFVIVIDYITRLSKEKDDIKFGYRIHIAAKSARQNNIYDGLLYDLDFADDIALLEGDNGKAQLQLDTIDENSAKVGLLINQAKTEQFQLNVPPELEKENLLSRGKEIKIVEEFKYLGSYVRSTEKDIDARIGLAWVAFAKLKSILRASRPTIEFKMRLFNAACISILLYGCESWLLTEDLRKKLDVFARNCYRTILNIRQSDDHVSNDDLYSRVKQRPIRDIIRERQLRFIGHCLRMKEDEPARIFALYKSNMGKNPPGNRLTYRSQISKYISKHISNDKKEILEAEEIARYAKDKESWKRIVAPSGPGR